MMTPFPRRSRLSAPLTNARRCQRFLAGLSLLLLTASTQAQTAPGLVIKPWSPDAHYAETFDDLMLVTGGHTKGDDHSIKTFYYDSYGRVKLDQDDANPDFSIGYRVLTMEIGGNHPDLPGGATDLAVAAALKLGEAFDGWQLSLIGGLGTANDNHFSNGDAIYGIGTINATKQVSPNAAWHVGLSYDGNRSIWPDLPLPYVTFQHRVDDKFAYAVGIPTSAVTWKPIDNITLEARYLVPFNIGAKATLHLTDELSVFGEYKQGFDGFWVHDRDNRRLFYESQRVQVGVRWAVDWIDVSAGVGYAFDQEYSTGFDARDTDTVADPSDEILVFLRIQGTF